ncbi:MAG: PorV/PorQ family protein [Bacteroidetes bacterium]|nr:PorV/PorQ family protein [Bacteroidota bacterium]MBU1115390.1 PorV/PorQ family protein [Bacteroidota bacterium]MBU1797911.1 PorV/PorQ family protein [Bacteroidota bacterium]
MKRISIIMSVFALMLGYVNQINAQGEAAVPFLLLAPDSRHAGLGESGTGLADNSSAIFWNPAGIAFQTGSEVGITHANWLPQFNLDLSYDYVTYRQYIDDIDGSVTASLTYMNYGEFQRTGSNSPDVIGTFNSFDIGATIGYATKLADDWGVGVNFRFIYSNLSDQPTENEVGSGVASTVSFDVGTMWRPQDFLDGNFSVGLNVSNIGPKISYIDQDQADPLPTNARVGFAYRVFQDDYNSFTVLGDVSKLLVNKKTGVLSGVEADSNDVAIPVSNDFIKSIEFSGGAEYWYGRPEDFMFAVRAGYFYEDPDFGARNFMTFGAGIKYDLYGFDFSYISTVGSNSENHPLDGTLRFSLVIGWDTVPQTKPGLPRGI